MDRLNETGIVVVEGSDAVGKTTLIKNALRTWAAGGIMLHCTYKRTPEAIERHLTRMFVIAVRYLLRGRWVFLDRWWPSDAVYAPAFNRPRISKELTNLFDMMLRDLHLGGYVICYDRHWEDTVARHVKMSKIRPEMYTNVADVAKHYTEFAIAKRPIGNMFYHGNVDPRLQIISPFDPVPGLPTFETKCRCMRANTSALATLARALPKSFNILK